MKGDGEPRLPLGEKVFVPLIGVFGAPKAGEHPHRPEAAPVHGRLDAASEGVLSREADIAHEIGVRNLIWSV